MRKGSSQRKSASSRKRGRCFWFTGLPGTGIREAIGTLSRELGGSEVGVVSLEDSVLHCYAEQFGGDRKRVNGYLERLKRSGGFKQILDEPPNIVQELWRRAAPLALQQVNAHLRKGRDTFFTFHAVYYADKFGDLYSPIDVSLVKEFPPPTKFLALIDDIGDVACRLRRDGQVFSNREKTGLRSVVDAVRVLLTILEWRSTDLTVSRLLGGMVGCPPFVFAVKHPVRSAMKILSEYGPAAYVSHSISEPRRFFKRERQWPPFMKQVQDFSDRLADSLDSTGGGPIPIVPTAIDELRIDSREIDGKEVPVPSLLDRWGLPKGPLLVEPPQDKPESRNWLDPRGYFEEKLQRGSRVSRSIERELQSIEGLITALVSRIQNQINARDHTLVAQCPVLVAYRPYVAWRVSGGVAAEVTHQTRQRAANKSKRRTIVFVHEPGDSDLRKLGIIVEAARLFKWVRGAAEVGEREIEKVLKDGLNHRRPATFSATDIRARVEEILKDASIKPAGPRHLDEDAVLGVPTTADTEEAANRLWQETAEILAEKDQWKSRADHWIEKEWTPERFAQRVRQLV
jgi:hypothetical protein